MISTELFTARPAGSVTFKRSSPVLLCANREATKRKMTRALFTVVLSEMAPGKLEIWA